LTQISFTKPILYGLDEEEKQAINAGF
jgi:glutathione S-transferase